MRRIFIDTSVFMEVLFGRQGIEKCVSLLSVEDATYYGSTLSAHILYYFGEKGDRTSGEIEAVLNLGKLLPLEVSSVNLARQRYRGADFEDCLQAACAEGGNCDEIITLDKNFKYHSRTSLKVSLVE